MNSVIPKNQTILVFWCIHRRRSKRCEWYTIIQTTLEVKAEMTGLFFLCKQLIGCGMRSQQKIYQFSNNIFLCAKKTYHAGFTRNSISCNFIGCDLSNQMLLCSFSLVVWWECMFRLPTTRWHEQSIYCLIMVMWLDVARWAGCRMTGLTRIDSFVLFG